MKRISSCLVAVALYAPAALAQSDQFALHGGDRVVFYGDSITDGAPYTYLIETFVSLRYPNLDVSFMNAGVGGDRVTGGWMGPIDQRMTRDLFSRKPTVVTSMLGMNDATYHPFKQDTFDTYRNGYQHMVDRIKKEAPDARVWLIRPSPYDDTTQKPGWDPGYNDVLVKYGDFVQQLATANGYGTVDLNAPMVDMLKRASDQDAQMAKKIVPDRVHPTPAGHVEMAAALLKTWHASAMVSDTKIDWVTGSVSAVNAGIKGWNSGRFTMTEGALPMPFDRKDPLTALVLRSSDTEQALNHEVLSVSSMPAGTYDLKIDGKPVGSFSEREFASGIDLAALDTAMIHQAEAVRDFTWTIAAVRYDRWRSFEFTLQDLKSNEKDAAIRSIERLERSMSDQRRKMAQPIAHQFEIVKSG